MKRQGLFGLQPLYGPVSEQENALWDPHPAPSPSWSQEKCPGPAQCWASLPPRGRGPTRGQAEQGSLRRGFICTLDTCIALRSHFSPRRDPRILTPVLPGLWALDTAPRSPRGDKATILRPPITTAHARVQGLEGPQDVTAMGVQGLGVQGLDHGELQPPTTPSVPIPRDHFLRGTRCPSPRSPARAPRGARMGRACWQCCSGPSSGPSTPALLLRAVSASSDRGAPGLHRRLH